VSLQFIFIKFEFLLSFHYVFISLVVKKLVQNTVLESEVCVLPVVDLLNVCVRLGLYTPE